MPLSADTTDGELLALLAPHAPLVRWPLRLIVPCTGEPLIDNPTTGRYAEQVFTFIAVSNASSLEMELST